MILFGKRRGQLERVLLPAVGFLVSFVLCGVMLAAFGINPFNTYGAIFSKAFGSVNGISQTIVAAIPMMMTAVGIQLAQRANVLNLGAEGQMILGAVGAQLAAMQAKSLPPAAAVGLTLLGGMVFGALWTLVPAVLRTMMGVNEIVVLIMMNQIAVYLLGYLVRGPLKDPASSSNQAVKLSEAARLPSIIPGTSIHLGIVFAALAVFAVWAVLKKTSYGYRISVVGLSPRSAVYAGIPLSAVMFMTFLISGGIAGLAGANQVAGVHGRLTGTVSNQYGWVGLTVAMLSGGNPAALILVSILYSALEVGGLVIQITQHVPMQLASILQAVTVLSVMCADHLYLLWQRSRKTGADLRLTEG